METTDGDVVLAGLPVEDLRKLVGERDNAIHEKVQELEALQRDKKTLEDQAQQAMAEKGPADMVELQLKLKLKDDAEEDHIRESRTLKKKYLELEQEVKVKRVSTWKGRFFLRELCCTRGPKTADTNGVPPTVAVADAGVMRYSPTLCRLFTQESSRRR